MVVGVEKMTHASTAEVTSALNCAMDNENDGPSGLTFPGLFGMAWRIHASQYGTTREDIDHTTNGGIAVKSAGVTFQYLYFFDHCQRHICDLKSPKLIHLGSDTIYQNHSIATFLTS